MLILTRKEGEQVMINNGSIRLKVLHVNLKDGMITIGFNAPEHVDIDRGEIFFKKRLQLPVMEGASL